MKNENLDILEKAKEIIDAMIESIGSKNEHVVNRSLSIDLHKAAHDLDVHYNGEDA